MKKWDNSHSAHALEILRITMFFDLVRELAAISLDKDARSPSIRNVLRLLESTELVEALKADYIKPLPITWINDVDADSKAFWEEKRKEEQVSENLKKFNGHLKTARDTYAALIQVDLYRRIKDTRNKMVAHYEMRKDGEIPRIFGPSDIELKWNDVEKYYEEIKPIILELQLLISNEGYAIDLYRENHDMVSNDFWTK